MSDSDWIYTLATASLGIFCGLGIFDGIYFHIYLYRLHMYPESRLEHWLHTARGFIFAPIAYLFFVTNASGLAFWAGFACLVVDLLLESFDVLVEKKAREKLGGMSSVEALIHVMATGFRMAALALVISQKPLAAWSLAPGLELPPFPPYLRWMGILFMVSTFWGGLSHVWLVYSGDKKKAAYRQKPVRIAV